ncbi:MAG TPA: phasin family protein [Dongiaceae bacterium]|jgi:phasin family protein|nr:phasin family protein [Dongiaceae bacterium]
MAKTNTVFDTDYFKMPDVTAMQNEFTRAFGDMAKLFVNGKAPTMDMESLASTQRKNMEAFTAANQVAFEGFKTVAQRQAELARQAVEDFGRAAKELSAVGTPEEKLARQAEFAKQSFETGLNNAREVFEMARKTGDDAVSLLSNRLAAQFDEMKAAFMSRKDVNKETVSKDSGPKDTVAQAVRR